MNTGASPSRSEWTIKADYKNAFGGKLPVRKSEADFFIDFHSFIATTHTHSLV